MKAALSTCLIALLSLMMLTAVEPTRAVADGCSNQSDPVPTVIKGTPVVYVHGWLGSNAGTSAAQAMLIKSLGRAFPILGFDYGPNDTTWAADPSISRCLADYIEKTSTASRAAGGSGKVIAVAHSMGGIGVRAASSYLASDDRSADLAGLVTVGTPHMGSPLAGGYATFNEWINRLWNGTPTPFPPSGSQASACLAWPRPASCAEVPYLAGGEKIATIAGQIQVTDSLFDLPIFPSRTYKIGDSIVLEPSANGYLGSDPGQGPSGTLLGSDTVTCNVTSSQINQKATSLGLFGLGGLGVGVDALSLGLAEDGTASPQMAASAAALNAMNMPCAHGQLPTNKDVVALTSKYIREMAQTNDQPPSAAPSPASSGPAAAGSSKWFGLTNDETTEITYKGGNYDARTATIRTTTYPKSLVFRWQDYILPSDRQIWIDYALSGKCTVFQTGVGISTRAVDPARRATFTILVDGAQKAQRTLSYYDEPQNFKLDVAGASRLRIQLDFPSHYGTAATWGTPKIYCTENPSPAY